MSLTAPAFLAHDDLEVSEEWRKRILIELQQCDLFVPILSRCFLESDCASQEVGVIVSRDDVVVAPLSIDATVPRGFISHVQSRRIPESGITRQLLVEPLAAKFPRIILPGLIGLVALAGSFRTRNRNSGRSLPSLRSSLQQKRKPLPKRQSAIAKSGRRLSAHGNTFRSSFASRATR